MIGKTLSHYEDTTQIGKAGMGEVCPSKGQKPSRDAEIRLLPKLVLNR